MFKPIRSLSVIIFCLLTVGVYGQSAEPPNIVFIIADDLNQFIGAYGQYDHVKTPNIDKLAAKGTLFTNAHSNAQICAPSRASLFTGIYPHHSANFGFENWRSNEVLRNSKTIMEQFRDHGYETAGVGKLMHHPWKPSWDEYGLKQDYTPIAFNGNDRVGHPSVPLPFRNIGPLDATFARLSDVPEVEPDSINPGHKGWYLYPMRQTLRYNNENDRDLLPDEKTVNWAINKIAEWESNESQKPFFLGVGLIRPHTPLVVPDRFFDMFPLDEIKLPPITENDINDTFFEQQFYPEDSKGSYHYKILMASFSTKEEALKTYYQAYLASIAFMDEEVGRFLDALESSTFSDNTIVVFTSDHGYTLGEKDQLFKNNLWESSTRIPLIIYDPATSQVPEIDVPVSLIDIYPTISEMGRATGDNRKNEKGHLIGGKSLIPLLTGDETDFEDAFALSVVENGQDTHFSLRTRHWRFIEYADGSEELYNHEIDPGEVTNLADSPTHKATKNKLKQKLQAVLLR